MGTFRCIFGNSGNKGRERVQSLEKQAFGDSLFLCS
uniref:Uncharacterized protein n=1 Tax=Siphoviridae sp. ctVJE9 TaxID=2825530 RepID=A0A8S5TUN7_9CAUD|nr:MAG TPA: hypothetical protein [Siphoviridae sp. ctVJE9]